MYAVSGIVSCPLTRLQKQTTSRHTAHRTSTLWNGRAKPLLSPFRALSHAASHNMPHSCSAEQTSSSSQPQQTPCQKPAGRHLAQLISAVVVFFSTWLSRTRSILLKTPAEPALSLSSMSLALLPFAALQFSPASLVADLHANPTFMAGLIGWACAQVLKVFTKAMTDGHWDWRMVFASGGMPSSHSAMCCAVTASVALLQGLRGALFPACLAFTLIVMYDAANVRYHAGIQAEVLNVVVAEMLQGHPVSEKKLKELIGHTPLQVAAGSVLGVAVAVLYHRFGLTV